MALAAGITISDRRKFQGYVLDEDTLRRVETLTSTIVDDTPVTSATPVQTSVSVRESTDRADLEYASVAALIEASARPDFSIERVQVKSRKSYDLVVSVQFWSDGDIDINAFGSDPDFTARVDRLRHEMAACEQEYSWPVKTLIFKSWPRDVLSLLTLICFATLVVLLVYFALFQRSLVNVDPALIVKSRRVLSAACRRREITVH